ncbi:hypothetical protein RXV86_15970 [Alisedimentitalea sp. MJ-SS2]|uniref:hypothetical protein n=1 Tax=Aliisedimentitalea sp. MJ-SS2 TaxID=3049795 RepID=UPI00290AF4F9|nr:hypothetical protein [Alisedimentitalea sp. MJ-SS2]MDU8928890.1 hypothetical protein [Alisedimentitalea sp. MJ-SS2]
MSDTAGDIVDFDDSVAEAHAKRRQGAISEGARAEVAKFAEAVAEHAEGELAEELREDAAELREVREGEEAGRYRLGSRLVKVVALGGVGLPTVLETLGYAEQGWGYVVYVWQIIKALIGV